MRKKIIVGNWKMNLNLQDAEDLVLNIKSYLSNKIEVDVGICPPFTYLISIINLLKDSNIKIGAQEAPLLA